MTLLPVRRASCRKTSRKIYAKASSRCTASAVRVNGVGVHTARLRVSSWHWLTESEEVSAVLSTLTICQALPPRCFTIASLRVQMRQNAASCCSGRSASTSACSPRLNTVFASVCQLSRGRTTSISQPTSPSSLSSRAISSPLWLRLNHSGVSAEKAGFPCSPYTMSGHGERAWESSTRPASQRARRAPCGACSLSAAGSAPALKTETFPRTIRYISRPTFNDDRSIYAAKRKVVALQKLAINLAGFTHNVIQRATIGIWLTQI